MSRKIVFEGRKVKMAVDTWTSPDGRTGQRDVVLHPGAVAMLPMVDDTHVCLIRNHRPVVDETLLEVPAGTLEPGEPPEQAAPRELAEETGYRAARWRKLCVSIPSPGILSERTHLFLAQDLTPGPQMLESDEELTPEIVQWGEAVAMVLDGRIHDAKTMLAILFWDRLKGP
jgi:ADP-ribose pyrophosphatase